MTMSVVILMLFCQHTTDIVGRYRRSTMMSCVGLPAIYALTLSGILLHRLYVQQ